MHLLMFAESFNTVRLNTARVMDKLFHLKSKPVVAVPG